MAPHLPAYASTSTDTSAVSTSASVPSGNSQLTVCNKRTRTQQLTLHGSYRFNMLSDTKKRKLDSLLASMVSKDLQTFSIVEDHGFRRFVKELDPRYELPSRRTLTRSLLPDLYSVTREKIRKGIDASNHVSVTTDIWSSQNTESYMTLTAHYFDSNFELKSAVLDTKLLTESHTAQYLNSVLKDITQEWGISNKIVCFVTDGGANIKAAVNLFGAAHFPCIAHKLNLVVNDVIGKHDILKQTLNKCKEIVTHFKSSVVAADKLRNMQIQLNKSELKLKQDVCTRWNSAVVMIERILEVKEPLAAAIASLPRAPTALTADEWQTIADCIPILKLLEMMTVQLSAEKYPTLSKVIPLVRGVQIALQKKPTETPAGKLLKELLYEGLHLRLGNIEKLKVSASATLLDPRFKTMGFGQHSDATAAQEEIKKELYTICSQQNPVPQFEESAKKASSDTDCELWNFLDTRVSNLKNTTTPTSNAVIVLRQYLEAPYEDRRSCPVAYWRRQKSAMPQLFDIALKYLCVPATSVPSERVFSKAGLIMSDRRSRIKSKMLNMMIFLNMNLE